MYNNVLGPSGSNNEELTVNNNAVNDVSKTNENDGNKSPKKKGKVVLIVILVLLLMGVMGFGGWKLGAMYATYENNKEVKEENKNNAVEKTDESSDEEGSKIDDDEKDDESNKDLEKEEVIELKKNSKYTFVKEHKSNITLNGKTLEFVTFYYLDLIKYKEEDGYFEGQIEEDYYEVRADLYVNSKKVLDAQVITFNTSKTNVDSFVNVNPKYETKELNDISNNNKYLLLFIESSYNYDNSYKNCFVINSDASVLATLPVKDSHVWFSLVVGKDKISNRNYITLDEFEKKHDYDLSELKEYGDYVLYYEDSMLDVYDSYIYYLEPSDECEGGTEHKFEVKDGKVIDKEVQVINNALIGRAGQC